MSDNAAAAAAAALPFSLSFHSCKITCCAGSVPGLAKRVVVALDVRTNDAGDLVVTKGDQYDVREGSTAAGGEVRPHSGMRCAATHVRAVHSRQQLAGIW